MSEEDGGTLLAVGCLNTCATKRIQEPLHTLLTLLTRDIAIILVPFQ
jgi:hypothetical protein